MWTYLANNNLLFSSNPTTISGLTPNLLKFEYIEIDDSRGHGGGDDGGRDGGGDGGGDGNFESRFDYLTHGYIDLMNDGFFDSFTNDYNMLFVSKYDLTENPIEREKLFEMEFGKTSISNNHKYKKN